MTKRFAKISSVLLVLGVLLMGSHSVFAQEATLRFLTDSKTVEVGDRVSVQLIVESTVGMGTIQGTLNYDKDRLRFLSGNSNALVIQDGKGQWNDFFQGNVTKVVYTLEFEAMAPGEAVLSVQESEIIEAESGTLLGTPSGTITITMKEKTTQVEEKPEKPQDLGFAGKDLSGGDIFIYYKIPEHMRKEGWAIETTSFLEHSVERLRSELEGWKIVAGLNPSLQEAYYLYDETRKVFIPFLNVHSQMDLILMEGATPPKGYRNEKIQIQGILVDGFANEDGDVLFYGRNTLGQAGFCRYDPQEKTLQRVLVQEKIQPAEPTEYDKALERKVVLWIAILVVLCLILAFSLLYYRKKIETLTASKK